MPNCVSVDQGASLTHDSDNCGLSGLRSHLILEEDRVKVLNSMVAQVETCHQHNRVYERHQFVTQGLSGAATKHVQTN